jgi:phenylalanyl-tRNA synthetase beta chain
VKRDISFVVAARVEYEEIRKALIAADPLVAEVVFFDVYEGKGVGAGKKSIALHILFRSPNRTLETSEADRAWDKIVVALKEKFGAEMRM